MISRRNLLLGALGVGGARHLLSTVNRARTQPVLRSKERIDRALGGRDVDRSPFSVWQSLQDERDSGAHHAELTLTFWKRVEPDLLKVMNEYAYPRPPGALLSVREEKNPFPEQIRALELIRDGLQGRAYFIETIPNPWHVTEALSSRAEVLRLKEEQPQQLLDCLEVIARSEANHAQRAVAAGAAGIFLGISNAQDGMLSPSEYARFSEPFDRMVLEAARSAPLNTLHIHTDAALGDRPHLELLARAWPANAINYFVHATGIPTALMRRHFSGLIVAGLDERRFRQLSTADLRAQWKVAREGAASGFMLAPGCTLPLDTTAAELRRLTYLMQQQGETAT
jgi:hypothetical protein